MLFVINNILNWLSTLISTILNFQYPFGTNTTISYSELILFPFLLSIIYKLSKIIFKKEEPKKYD